MEVSSFGGSWGVVGIERYQPALTETEQMTLLGFPSGHRTYTRDAYTLDLRRCGSPRSLLEPAEGSDDRHSVVDAWAPVATLYRVANRQGTTLDRVFGALGDANRRTILDRVAGGPVSISALAVPLGLSLPGVLKHVRVLEDAELVVTRKVGRTRMCELRARPLDEVAMWVDGRRRRWELLLDHLAAHVAEPGVKST